MEEPHRDNLRVNRMAICTHEFDIMLLLDVLCRRKVLTENDKSLVIAEKSLLKMKEKLLDILPKRGPNVYNEFLASLSELNLSELRSLLTGAADSSPQLNEMLDTFDGPPKRENSEEENAGEDVDGPFGKKKPKTSIEELQQASVTLPRVYPDPELNLEDCYDMSTQNRGHFLLINNKDFLPSSGMDRYPRNGTDVDAEAIQCLFEELGFNVDAHRNLSVYEMRREIKKAANMDYSVLSSFVCCILSHGQEGVLYGIDGTIDIRELTSYFKGRNLAGKPKVFFFQACQGSEYMDCVEPDSGFTEVDGPPESNDISLPSEADFLYAYSTVPGYYSWRNSARGSWFIQGICEVFRRHAHKMDIVRMLTRVNQIVSTKKSQTGQRQSHHKRQIPSIITQLRKELYFFPPQGPLTEYKGIY